MCLSGTYVYGAAKCHGRGDSDRAEIWVGCQNPLGFRQHLAANLGLDLEQVTLHNYFMGGGFGRKSNADYALQAAMIARQVGRPVQMVYSRGEDIKQDFIALRSRADLRRARCRR